MKTSSSFYTFSILPSPHPSCWRNSQPSLQVAGLPRPAEHVFSSPGRVTLRSFIHFQWYSGPRSPACILIICCALATDDEFLSANRQIKEERIWKERRKMDRPPPACLQTPLVPGSLQLNHWPVILREESYVVPLLLFRCFNSGMVLNFDRKWIFFQDSEELKENIFGATHTGYSRFKASLDFDNMSGFNPCCFHKIV